MTYCDKSVLAPFCDNNECSICFSMRMSSERCCDNGDLNEEHNCTKRRKTMKKIPPKNKINQKEYESVVTGHTNDLLYILHNVTSLMRRMNRDGKIEDYEKVCKNCHQFWNIGMPLPDCKAVEKNTVFMCQCHCHLPPQHPCLSTACLHLLWCECGVHDKVEAIKENQKSMI